MPPATPPSAAPPRILVVDAQPRRRAALAASIRRLDLEPRAVRSLAAAEVLVGIEDFQAALISSESAGGCAQRAFSGLLRSDPGLPLIVVDGQPTTDTAVHCLMGGAWGYVQYPCRRGVLGRLFAQLRALVRAGGPAWTRISATRSPVMRRVLAEARRAAGSDAPVLVRGETGTGKGLLAQAIHELSPRHRIPLVVIDCASLAGELQLSELFGHVRGAFTDATSDHPGRIALAEGGTLLLDEIGELPPLVQARLLRFLQDRSYERLGESRTRRADVRLLATTIHDPAQLVAQGRLREDLYYRLAVVELELPPLRKRPEDIVPLVLDKLARTAAAGIPPRRLSADCRGSLLAHLWPGNLHELNNEIGRAALLAHGAELTAADLTARIRQRAVERPWLGGPFALHAVVDEHLRRIVESAPTLQRAAAILGIQSSTLWHRRLLLREAGGLPPRDRRRRSGDAADDTLEPA